MTEFQSKLLRKVDIAEGTTAFYLEKPTDFSFIPGQHGTFRIINPAETDSEGDGRTFSFINLPTDAEIAFATRMRDSAFKKNLKNAVEGLEIEIKNPRGSMVLPTETKRPLVFMAGGIGITPLISMIREATSTNSAQKITLFYANRTIAQTAFFQELAETAQKNPNFSFVPTMTKETTANWQGETGYITKEMLSKYVPNATDTLFYLAGPTGMVSATIELLKTVGVDPLFIKSEDYGDYK